MGDIKRSGGRHHDGWWNGGATAQGVMKVDNLLRQHPQEPERGKGTLNLSAKANRHIFDVSYLAFSELLTGSSPRNISETTSTKSAGKNH